MVQELSSQPGSRRVRRCVLAALIVAAAVAFLVWFALSGVPDLWVVLNALLQPR